MFKKKKIPMKLSYYKFEDATYKGEKIHTYETSYEPM